MEKELDRKMRKVSYSHTFPVMVTSIPGKLPVVKKIA